MVFIDKRKSFKSIDFCIEFECAPPVEMGLVYIATLIYVHLKFAVTTATLMQNMFYTIHT